MTAEAPPRVVISCGMAETVAYPAASSSSRTYSSSPKANGPTGLFPGRRCAGRGREWAQHRAHVPRIPFDPCQQANTRRPMA